MCKELNEMTLTELWQLFPIKLVPHEDVWREYYKEESAQIAKVLCDVNYTLNHVGSTSVDGIMAKAIVDLLLEVNEEDINTVATRLKDAGWTEMSRTDTRISFNKGYTKHGFADKVFHLHLRIYGDNKEIFFRNYLEAHPSVAKEYEALKLSLAAPYEHDRDGYTEAKSQFINKYTALAIAEAKSNE